VDECAVINASPLIFLSRGGYLDLLQRFAGRLLIPRQVADELLRRGPDDPAARAFSPGSPIQVADIAAIPPLVAGWGLGAGESAVLALAFSVPGAVAILDDLAGRRCAAALGVPVRGTLGMVLTAKQRGWIPLARPVLEDLIRGGMYLSRRVLDEALSRVGE
jgi:predicted nucleic acid-binding protein